MCRSARTHHRQAADDNDGRRRPEPIIPEPHDLRASDAERERVVEALRAHAGAGRLSTDELERRVEIAYAAGRRDELAALLGDLPRLSAGRPLGPSSTRHLHKTVAVAALLLVIWAVTGAGYFWPIWPIGAMALSLLAGRAAIPMPIGLGHSAHRPR